MSLMPVRILAIDDEPFILALFRRALRRYEVTAVEPKQALKLEPRDFDVIVCDFNLPKQQGQRFHRYLVGGSKQLARRVILCTGGSMDEDGWKLLESEPWVLYKPFSNEALHQAIRRVLESTCADVPVPGNAPREPFYQYRIV